MDVGDQGSLNPATRTDLTVVGGLYITAAHDLSADTSAAQVEQPTLIMTCLTRETILLRQAEKGKEISCRNHLSRTRPPRSKCWQQELLVIY